MAMFIPGADTGIVVPTFPEPHQEDLGSLGVNRQIAVVFDLQDRNELRVLPIPGAERRRYRTIGEENRQGYIRIVARF